MTLQEKLNQIGAKKRYISKIRKVNIIIKTLLLTILLLTIIGLIAKTIKGNITIEEVNKTLIICIPIIIGINLVMQFNRLIKKENYNIRNTESELKIAKKYHLKDDEFVEIMSVYDENSELRCYAMLILEQEKISVKIVKKIEENKFENVIDNFCYFQAIYKPKS